jgi:hypothetical protein
MDKHTTEKIKVQAIPAITIPHYADVKFLRLGENHAEVLYMESMPKQTIRKISKTEYEIIRTGERKQFDTSPDTKKIKVIKKSMRRLEQLIKANFDTVRNADNALFVTLTYREPNHDTEQLFIDFDRFMKRLKRAYKGHKLDYITVAEPHESGAWHLHMLVKSDQPKLYISNNETMEPTWGHGFTRTVRLKSDDVGCYYTAYFSNVEAPIGEPDTDPDAEFAFMKDEDGKQKRFKKGDRLRFYPKNMKFYRCSRGIERPSPETIKHSEVPKDLGKPRKALTYSLSKKYKKMVYNTTDLCDEHADVEYKINTVQREYYKKTKEYKDKFEKNQKK